MLVHTPVEGGLALHRRHEDRDDGREQQSTPRHPARKQLRRDHHRDDGGGKEREDADEPPRVLDVAEGAGQKAEERTRVDHEGKVEEVHHEQGDDEPDPRSLLAGHAPAPGPVTEQHRGRHGDERQHGEMAGAQHERSTAVDPGTRGAVGEDEVVIGAAPRVAPVAEELAGRHASELHEGRVGVERGCVGRPHVAEHALLRDKKPCRQAQGENERRGQPGRDPPSLTPQPQQQQDAVREAEIQRGGQVGQHQAGPRDREIPRRASVGDGAPGAREDQWEPHE